MIRHVASIAEIVDDFDAAVRFYRDALGLEVAPKPDGNYADVLVDGVVHFGIWRRSHVRRGGADIVQPGHVEPWGQTTCRFASLSGGVCELAATPWARTLKSSVLVRGPA